MEFVTPQAKPTANTLLFGPPKSGKTIGACTAPGGLLLVNGDLSGASRQAHLRNPDGRIMEVRLPEFEPSNRTALLDLLGEIAREVAKPDQTMIESVVVDPFGELYRRLLEETSVRAIRPKRDYYGDVGTHLERFARFLCSIPTVNVVICCHELSQENDGVIEKIPFTGTRAGSATLGQKLMGMVDIVGYCGIVEQEDGGRQYLAQLIASQGRNGGDRFACLGDFREVNIAEWLEVIEENEKQLIAGSTPGSVGGSAVSTLKQGSLPPAEIAPEVAPEGPKRGRKAA